MKRLETHRVWGKGHTGYKPYFEKIMPRVNHIEGSLVEAGFGKGVTANVIVKLMNNGKLTKRDIWLFDSFEGFPHPHEFDKTPNRSTRRGEWKVPMGPALRLKESIDTNVEVVKGFFQDTIPAHYEGGQIAILHLDCDLYNSYKNCLEGLYDKVAPGGLILFDEYRAPIQLKRFPGAAKAIDEFFENRNVDVEWGMVEWPGTQKYYMFKPK